MGAQAVRLSNVDIDNALKNKDFEVIFQPVFDLGNGALARVEAFVRWRHPALGVLPPGAFISFFESQGRMSELTRYVLGEALSAYLDWRGPYAPGFSINLALSDLTDEAFASHFTKLMRDRNFPADLVTLECPMPPVDQDLASASAQFERLTSTGARLAIEVRGRANDFLRGIDPFPFQEIKTGGSAILRFARTVRGPGLSAIADLLDIANKSNAAITAVGVEDQASLAALRGLGFTAAQGNHLAKVGALSDFRPARVNDVRELLGLEALEKGELGALFRTESPSLPSSAPAETPETLAAEPAGDALVERLNERVSQQAAPTEKMPQETAAPAEPPQQPAAQEDPLAPAKAAKPAAKTPMSDEERKARARAKAKALVLAKRAKAREALKAAAIERAKLKSLHTGSAPEGSDTADTPLAEQPRALQERISREFSKSSGEEAAPAAAKPQAAPAGQRAPQAPAPAAADAQTGDDISKPARLEIKHSGAYFQPGIHVGNPQLAAARAKAAAAQPEAVDASAGQRAAEARAPEAPAPQAEAAAPSPKPGSHIVQGDLLTETDAPHEPVIAAPEEAEAAARPAKRRKKPFLKRTVIAYPTHFWPKSWKRQWRKAAGARRKPEETATS